MWNCVFKTCKYPSPLKWSKLHCLPLLAPKSKLWSAWWMIWLISNPVNPSDPINHFFACNMHTADLHYKKRLQHQQDQSNKKNIRYRLWTNQPISVKQKQKWEKKLNLSKLQQLLMQKKKKINITYSKSHTSSCSNKTSKKDSSDLGTSSKTIQGSIWCFKNDLWCLQNNHKTAHSLLFKLLLYFSSIMRSSTLLIKSMKDCLTLSMVPILNFCGMVCLKNANILVL